jgi:hypothetical protein
MENEGDRDACKRLFRNPCINVYPTVVIFLSKKEVVYKLKTL